MSTDREQLAALLRAVEGSASYRESASLRAAADGARRHLLLVESPDGDCRARIEAHGQAAYAAGQAAGVDARPNRRQGIT